MSELKLKKVKIYEIRQLFTIAKILNLCGKDMKNKFGLHHWDNPMIKSFIIVVLSALKNQVYLVGTSSGNPVATFQIKQLDETLFFEKLAVVPSMAGNGYGSYCIKEIEEYASRSGLKKVQMEVYDQSLHAIEFYKHKGYLPVGSVRTLKYSNLVMEKTIRK